MGDGDNVVAEAEREEHLGRRWDKAYDAHMRSNDMTTPRRCSQTMRSPHGCSGSNGRSRTTTIVRDLKFEDFAAAIAFVNRVAEFAETYNHHPDILVHGWNKVKLSLTNHAAGGLTEIDFDMAARFDALPE